MKQLSSLIFLFSMAAVAASAQKYTTARPSQTEWAEKPMVHPVPPEYAHEQAIVLLNDVSLDFRKEGRSLYRYATYHRIVKVLNDRGIENFNTIDLPLYFNSPTPSIKARTILPNGKVKEIAQNMMMVTRNQHGTLSIIIAMEGVEKNAEIEYLVREIEPGNTFGQYSFQADIPVLATHFRMSYPKDYFFEEKGYNGFPDGKDTLINNRRHISVALYDIPKLRREPVSFYDLYVMRAEYRIDHYFEENATNKIKAYTWADLGRLTYDNYYKISDKERAAVNQYLTQLGVRPNGNAFANMKKIENGIKTNILQYGYIDYDDTKEVLATHHIRSVSLYDVAFDETKNPLDSIISKHAATPEGIIKLFVACFVQAGINFEFGYAGDRHDHVFDTKFVNWDNIDEALFYFPDFKKFLAPNHPLYRFPVVPEEVLGNKGVFCAIPPNGFLTGDLIKIRRITPLSAKQTQRNIAAAVSFTKDLDAVVDVSYSYTGYASADLRNALSLMTPDKQKDLVKNTVTFARKPTDILKYTISNETPDNYYTNKPLEITATVSTSGLTDDAGKNFLFKVGEIIGRHSELYTNDERVLPVDLDYPYMQNRTITINLPPGYKVLNPGILRKHAEYVNREIEPVISFNSDYTLVTDKKKGDKLVIRVSESYTQLHFSPQYYERYREIINTAADFSKATLVISKKDGGRKQVKKADRRITKK